MRSLSSGELSALCLHCGLCCDGSLFAHVSLTQSEAQELMARDVAVGLRPDRTYVLNQRCGALEGKCCTVYEARPEGCRKYVCLLATALGTNEVSLPEAKKVVDEAHAQLAVLDELVPRDDGAPSSPVRRAQSAQDGSLKPEAAAAWEKVREYLRRHFTGRFGL